MFVADSGGDDAPFIVARLAEPDSISLREVVVLVRMRERIPTQPGYPEVEPTAMWSFVILLTHARITAWPVIEHVPAW